MSVLAHIVRKDGVVSCLSKILMQCSLRGVDTLTHCSLRGVDTLTHFSLRGVDAMLSRLVKYRLAALRITCPAGKSAIPDLFRGAEKTQNQLIKEDKG